MASTAIRRIAAFEIVPEGRFVASFKMLPLAVALLENFAKGENLPYAAPRDVYIMIDLYTMIGLLRCERILRSMMSCCLKP